MKRRLVAEPAKIPEHCVAEGTTECRGGPKPVANARKGILEPGRIGFAVRFGKFHLGAFCLILLADLSNGAMAQDAAASAEEVQRLRSRIEQLERRLAEFEKRLGPQPVVDPDARVQELDQKIRILERQGELDEEAAAAKAKETPKLSVGEKGFSFTSADTNFSLQIKGVLQVDSRSFFEDSIAGNDGFLLRRARPVLQGTLFHDFEFQFVPDFGGSGAPQIFDAWVSYKYSPALQLRAGKFKVPFGLEQLQADKDTLFTERALPTGLVPNRDIGVQLYGELFEGVVGYAAGIFNGVGDGRNSSNVDFEDDRAFAGRLFVQPLKSSSTAALQGLGIGIAATYETFQRTNTAGLPNNNGYATPAQQQFFVYRSGVVADGSHWRLSPQGSYLYGPFGLIGEYVISNQEVSRPGIGAERLENTGWQVSAGWVLTGEDASFTGIVPRQKFNPREGTWGALQLVARYSELNLDSRAFDEFANSEVSARSAQEYAIGLNWYLNRNVRISTVFSHIDFTGGGGSGTGAPASVTRQDENVLFTRIQLAF